MSILTTGPRMMLPSSGLPPVPEKPPGRLLNYMVNSDNAMTLEEQVLLPDSVVKDEDTLGTSLLLEEFFDLLVVNVLDALLICEIFLLTDMLDELEAGGVQRHRVLLATNVMNESGMRIRADVRLLLSLRRVENVLVGSLSANLFEVVQDSGGVTGSEYSCCSHVVRQRDNTRIES